jgi:hypothetical protein
MEPPASGGAGFSPSFAALDSAAGPIGFAESRKFRAPLAAAE